MVLSVHLLVCVRLFEDFLGPKCQKPMQTPKTLFGVAALVSFSLKIEVIFHLYLGKSGTARFSSFYTTLSLLVKSRGCHGVVQRVPELKRLV